MPIRVLLVDDVADLRLLLRLTLGRRPNLEVVAEAATGHEAIVAADATKPDVIVLDLGLPDLAGHEVLTRLRVVAPDAKVVVLTGAEVGNRGSIRDVADAFLSKAEDQAFLADVLEEVAASAPAVSLLLTADLESVRAARVFVTRTLEEWACDNVDAAALVTSELVTNAIVHANSSVRVTLRRRLGSVRIDVVDTGTRTPQPRIAGDEDESGRGLLLVAALAGAWGIDPTDDGKLVWAEMACARVPTPT